MNAPTGDASRRRTGARAEDEAVAFLVALGWRVVARNWTVRQGELDIVAMDGEVLVFVEVKSRATRSSAAFGGALMSITPQKRRKLVAAASRYLAEVAPPGAVARFDVLWRDGPDAPWNLLTDAFRSDSP